MIKHRIIFRESKITGSKLGGQVNKNITFDRKGSKHLPSSDTSIYSYFKVTHQSKRQRNVSNDCFTLECIFLTLLFYIFHPLSKTNVKEENLFWLT